MGEDVINDPQGPLALFGLSVGLNWHMILPFSPTHSLARCSRVAGSELTEGDRYED